MGLSSNTTNRRDSNSKSRGGVIDYRTLDGFDRLDSNGDGVVDREEWTHGYSGDSGKKARSMSVHSSGGTSTTAADYAEARRRAQRMGLFKSGAQCSGGSEDDPIPDRLRGLALFHDME